MMPPAFVTSMCATPSAQPSRNPSSTSRTRAAKPSKPRKRVRASELTRKYRAPPDTADESLLVGGTSSTPSTSRKSSPQSRYLSATVRFSRFPGSWPEAVDQVGSAVVRAVAEGHDRVRVDVKRPELIATCLPTPVDGGVFNECGTEACRVALLVEAACNMIEHLLQLDPNDKRNFGLCFKPRRAALHFNSAEDAEVGARFVKKELAEVTDLYVLGEKAKDRPKADITVVIAPTNRQGNPAHIETVEMVHYAHWTHPRIVIMFNPDIVALTSFAAFGDGPREPGFLADYMPSYYLDPAAFPSKTAIGAVLRCFPRKWEMYLLKVQSDMGFRLVAEQHAPPSPEKIQCEFSWRIDPELGRAVSF